jgi:hypothetical protein
MGRTKKQLKQAKNLTRSNTVTSNNRQKEFVEVEALISSNQELLKRGNKLRLQKFLQQDKSTRDVNAVTING